MDFYNRTNKKNLDNKIINSDASSDNENMFSRRIFTKVNKNIDDEVQTLMQKFSDNSDNSDNCDNLSNSTIDRSDPEYFINKGEKIINNRTQFVKDNNNFLNQFDELRFDNPGDPVSFNSIPKSNNIYSRIVGVINNNKSGEGNREKGSFFGGWQYYNNVRIGCIL